MWLISILVILQGLSYTSNGILKGMGYQEQASYLMLASNYLTAIPVGGYLAFNTELHVDGFFVGLCLAPFVFTLVSGIYLKYFVNFEKLALKANLKLDKYVGSVVAHETLLPGHNKDEETACDYYLTTKTTV